MTDTDTPRRSRRYPDMSRADVRDTMWIDLRQAHRAVRAGGLRPWDQGYRDGLLTAYAILTGNDPETIWEDLEDGLTA